MPADVPLATAAVWALPALVGAALLLLLLVGLLAGRRQRPMPEAEEGRRQMAEALAAASRAQAELDQARRAPTRHPAHLRRIYRREAGRG